MSNILRVLVGLEENKRIDAELRAVRPVWERAKKILDERPARHRKNSVHPEIWQFFDKEREAANLRRQLEALARELGIES